MSQFKHDKSFMVVVDLLCWKIWTIWKIGRYWCFP